MSGTFEMDGLLFSKDPLQKRWRRQEVAVGGEAESIFAAPYTLEMDFGILEASDHAFFFDRFTAGGLHTAVLPHPRDGNLTGFTGGVNFKSLETEYMDVDANSFVQGTRVVLDHILLNVTGTP